MDSRSKELATIEPGLGRRIVRTGLLLSLLLALVATGLAPRVTDAATGGQITLSSYMSPVKCSYSGESYCSYADGSQYNLVQINGWRFMKNGIVQLRFFLNGQFAMGVQLKVDGSGNFVYKSKSFQFCLSGTPLTVQATDIGAFTMSNVLTIRVC